MTNLIQKQHMFLANGHDPINVAYFQGQLARYIEFHSKYNPYVGYEFRKAWDDGWARADLDITEQRLVEEMQ